MTISDAFFYVRRRLTPLYDEREATSISHELLQHITGMDKLERLMRKGEALTANQQQHLNHAVEELLLGRPLQYVVGYAWFMGRKYVVNEQVLIPRPETEELVQWVTDHCLPRGGHLTILEVGTGSGCIAVSLALALPGCSITSIDISQAALKVAVANAEQLGAHVRFLAGDFLNTSLWPALGSFDVVVSNPPYIPEAEKKDMHHNVLDFEPHQALFVPNNDPLLFYRAIAEFSQLHLNKEGSVFCEISSGLPAATKQLFESSGFEKVTTRQDMHGNWRMIKAER